MIDNINPNTDTMRVIEQSYWSFQQTQDGKSWNEIFQINDPDEELTEKDAFNLGKVTDPTNIGNYPQFYRVQRETRNILSI